LHYFRRVDYCVLRKLQEKQSNFNLDDLQQEAVSFGLSTDDVASYKFYILCAKNPNGISHLVDNIVEEFKNSEVISINQFDIRPEQMQTMSYSTLNEYFSYKPNNTKFFLQNNKEYVDTAIIACINDNSATSLNSDLNLIDNKF